MDSFTNPRMKVGFFTRFKVRSQKRGNHCNIIKLDIKGRPGYYQDLRPGLASSNVKRQSQFSELQPKAPACHGAARRGLLNTPRCLVIESSPASTNLPDATVSRWPRYVTLFPLYRGIISTVIARRLFERRI